MSNLKIHWKGYPHRRFPRIRFASRSLTSSNHSLAHAAAKNVLKQPLGKALGQERSKQRFRIGRRRLQSSRSSSSAVRARKRATVRARQHIQIFGWDTPQADAASRTSKATLPAKNPEPTTTKQRVNLPSRYTRDHNITQSTVIDSNDGAAASLVQKLKPDAPASPYSLMHVAEVPVYWKSTRSHIRTRPSDQFITSPVKPSGKGYAHVRPLDTVSRRRPPYPDSPQEIGRSRTYDHRIDPKNRVNNGNRAKSAPAPANTQISKEKKTPEPSFNPELRRTIESYASNSRENRASVQSLKSAIKTILSDASSRSPSQKKALKHFTKELELYIQATRSLPKKSLIASPTVTTVSANTVEDLKPFQAEFNAAGLAVTSEQQRRKSSIMPRLKKSIAPPETPPKDDKWKYKTTDPSNHHHRKTSSSPSFSSGTTVMGWTPPHEAALRQQQQKSHGTSYTMSSDHTVMAFTPPHEQTASQKQGPPTASRSPARKSLPWLRQPATPPRSPPSPTNRIQSRSSATRSKSNHPLPEDTLTSLIMNIPATPKEYVEEPIVSQRSQRKSEVRWNDSIHMVEKRPDDRARTKVDRYADASTQINEEAVKEDETPDERRCANAITQTELIKVDTTSVESSIIEPRAPMTSGRSKTFPMNAHRCTNNCNQEASRTLETLTAENAESQNRYIEQTTQTETPPESPENRQSVVLPDTISFEPTTRSGDRSRTFPLTSTPRGGSIPYRPFQATMALRSARKSVGPYTESPEKSSLPSPIREGPSPLLQGMPPSPEREAPSPPLQSESGLQSPELTQAPMRTKEVTSDLDVRATSLSRYIEAETRIPSPEPEPTPEKAKCPSKPEMRAIPDPRGGLLHQCTDRSLECEQCSPQNEGPLFPPPPDCRIAQEQSTKACNYEGGGNVETEKCCLTSVERCMPDPVKRPPLSKMRIRHTHQAHVPHKHTHVKCTSPLPPIPTILDPCPLSESRTNYDTCTSTETPRSGRITDKQVFRGLHVATAAACDEDVDKWIEEIMGSGVRRFLADLSAFDGLGINSLATVARRAAKQRRDQVRAWERIREQKLEERADEIEGKTDIESRQGKSMDRKFGLSAGDATVTLRSLREADQGEAME